MKNKKLIGLIMTLIMISFTPISKAEAFTCTEWTLTSSVNYGCDKTNYCGIIFWKGHWLYKDTETCYCTDANGNTQKYSRETLYTGGCCE